MWKQLLISILVAVVAMFFSFNWETHKFVDATYVPYTFPPIPGLEGKYGVNEELSKVHHLAGGKIHGPESVTFGTDGLLYVSTADGEIFKINVETNVVEHFVSVGGRPLGMKFDAEGNLIIAEPVKGLLSVDPNTKEIKILTFMVGDSPITFANDVEISKETGKIYFTDSAELSPVKLGGKWVTFVPAIASIVSSNPTGRLLEYDPKTRITKQLANGFIFSNGVALSKEEDFILVAESGRPIISKYHLKGPKAGTLETFADNLPGLVDGLSTAPDGRFWVSFHCVRSPALEMVSPYPWIKKIAVTLKSFISLTPPPSGLIALLDENGNAVLSLHDTTGKSVSLVSDVEEKDGKLYIGSLTNKWVAVYDLH